MFPLNLIQNYPDKTSISIKNEVLSGFKARAKLGERDRILIQKHFYVSDKRCCMGKRLGLLLKGK
jgi:hypothetical protein